MGSFFRKHATYEELEHKIVELSDELELWKERYNALLTQIKASDIQVEELQKELEEKAAVIQALKNEVAHLKAVSEHDGTNTGIPTSATPIGKKKPIPNSRAKSDKKKGGQPGHKKHNFTPPESVDETESISYTLDQDAQCKVCGGPLIDTGNVIIKTEYDVKVSVVKRNHEFKIYQCVNCGTEVHLPIPNNLKEENQYGGNVQALALSLMATGNVAVNKVSMLIAGMTDFRLCLSNGFLCKLFKRSASLLSGFVADLRRVLIQRTLVYWDETVIWIQTERACLRFYGDETIAYYTAHMHKDLEGLMQDNILPVLTGQTTVMHDHNKVNYNENFSFENIECNQHLQRDLQQIADDNPTGHGWASKLKALISTTIHLRNQRIALGFSEFSGAEIQDFKDNADRFLDEGRKENEAEIKEAKEKNIPIRGATAFERSVLNRFPEFEDNYFRWVEDWNLPTTDNLSERSLRNVKTKLKVSGQFDSELTAQYYAVVKTYTETCRRNGINEMEALSRLCAGNPYTVKEVIQNRTAVSSP